MSAPSRDLGKKYRRPTRFLDLIRFCLSPAERDFHGVISAFDFGPPTELCDADNPTYSEVGLADEIVEIALKDGRALRIVVRVPITPTTCPGLS